MNGGVVQICQCDNGELVVHNNAVGICKEDVHKIFDIWDESGKAAALVHGEFHECNVFRIDVD